jgi:hypothetical protein
VSRRFLWASLFTGAALSSAVLFRLASQLLVFGSPQGNWFYRYIDAFHAQAIEVWVVSTVLAAGLLSTTWNARKWNEWLIVLAWCICALPLQALVRSLNPFTFASIFASDAANSFYSVALKYDAATILRDFERLRPSWPLHAQSNLPGKLLLVRSLVLATSNPNVLAWLVVAISNAGGALMYLFVRDLFDNRRMALLAMVFYLFVPAKLFFFPLLNAITPVVVLGCACLLLKWLRTGRAIYAALLGVAIYVMILFDPGSLAVGLLFAAIMMCVLSRRDLAPKVMAFHTAIGAAAFAGTYIFMALWFEFNLAAALRGVATDAAQFNLKPPLRPYDIWVRQNLIDFVFGIGLMQFVALPATIADGLATNTRTRMCHPGIVVGLSLIAMLFAVDLIGVNRGEVIRLWIFLACLFQIPAAYICARVDNEWAGVAVIATTFLQIVLGSSMVGFIVPG